MNIPIRKDVRLRSFRLLRVPLNQRMFGDSSDLWRFLGKDEYMLEKVSKN
jgi:hypothetical protein